MLYAAALMMHPVVPKGCEKIAECMNIPLAKFFNWNNFYETELNDVALYNVQVRESLSTISATPTYSMSETRILKVKDLPPRFDFFRKHETQYK